MTRFIATCKMGLESTVSRQLCRLGMENVAAKDARVYFSGNYDSMCRAALWLRTAERLYVEVSAFHAETFDELYQGVRSIRWEEYIGRNSKIHVNGKTARSRLFSVSDCQKIAKKAIIDRLSERYHTSFFPENGEEVIVDIAILKDDVTAALDCCGAGLSRRGYRTFNVPAPLSETLAAGIVLLSGFHGEDALLDPMCGSGTIPIEAALIAQNKAPGLQRSFSSEAWRFLPAGCWKRAREEAMDSVRPSSCLILGSDIDPRCVDLCRTHARKAGVRIDWSEKGFEDVMVPGEYGQLVTNPPYGERLMDRNASADLYRKLFRCFHSDKGWGKNIITAHPDFERAYGKKADRRRKLSNGGLSCTLYQYYPDTRKPRPE